MGIKSLVDNIVASGAKIDIEDIILYILNGLPSQYQSFKTAIRTKLNPIRLKDLYSLLISKEINVVADLAKEIPGIQSHAAMYINKDKKSAYPYKGKCKYQLQTSEINNYSRYQKSGNTNTEHGPKFPHIYSAIQCWHRMNANFRPQQKALYNASNPTSDE